MSSPPYRHGKSPVEHLTGLRREFVRTVASPLLRGPAATVGHVLTAGQTALADGGSDTDVTDLRIARERPCHPRA